MTAAPATAKKTNKRCNGFNVECRCHRHRCRREAGARPPVQGGRQGDAELASLLRGQAWHRAHPRGLQAELAWKDRTLSEGCYLSRTGRETDSSCITESGPTQRASRSRQGTARASCTSSPSHEGLLEVFSRQWRGKRRDDVRTEWMRQKTPPSTLTPGRPGVLAQSQPTAEAPASQPPRRHRRRRNPSATTTCRTTVVQSEPMERLSNPSSSQ